MEIFPFPFLSSDNFQALRSTNFSRESFVSREPFSSSDFQVSLWWAELWYEVWVVDLRCQAGEAMPKYRYLPKYLLCGIFSDIASPLTEQHLSRFVGRGIAPKKLPGNISILFSKEKKMMEQTLRSFVFLLAPSQEHMFERKLIKHRGSDKASFHNRILLNFCK